jgi:hypothetical protein
VAVSDEAVAIVPTDIYILVAACIDLKISRR